MAELVDALVSNTNGSNTVPVRSRLRVHEEKNLGSSLFFCPFGTCRGGAVTYWDGVAWKFVNVLARPINRLTRQTMGNVYNTEVKISLYYGK